jgi:TP901 family phage tail tape measure protein
MAEITQVLGFDAAQAIQTLNLLDGALAKFDARLQQNVASLKAFNTGGRATATTLSRLARNATNAANALGILTTGLGGVSTSSQNAANSTNAITTAAQQASTALANAGAAGQGAGQNVATGAGRARSALALTTRESGRFTTSLELLSRVVFTQAIVRALSTIRNSFKATAAEAIEFQRQLALIRTIDDSGRSLSQLSSEVRALSDEFNIPLLDAAAGLYQTISNQVGDTGESLKFTAEAAKFAKSTNSQLADSVDLLSGALKSYNLGVEDTDRVSSVFFKTIDLGRITADQLSNAFGRVGPAAAEAGVELEEVGAALAAISVRGSNTPETLTQFRNIITALIKPSDSMKKALRGLGFESGESAIKTLGLSGVLRELSASTKGSSSAMAALFPNIRGLNGVAALTGDELKTLAANIDEMRVASENFAEEKFLIATATDAEKVTAQINKLKNAFTVDLGQSLLRVTAQLSDTLGGVDNVVAGIQSAGPAIAGFTASAVALTVALKGASFAGLALSSSLIALAGVPLAFGAGKSIGEFLDRKLLEKTTKAVRDSIEANKKRIEELSESLEKAADEAAKADDNRVQSARKATRQISNNYLTLREVAKSANDGMVKATKSSVNEIILAYDKLAEAQQRAIADSKQAQDAAENRIRSIRGQQEDIEFQQRTANLSDAQKAFALTKRAADLSREAAQTLANAGGNQQQINIALEQRREAERAAAEALSLAQRTGDKTAIARAFQQQKNILDDQVRAERTLLETEKKREAGLIRTRLVQKSLLDQVREQAKIIQDNTGIFDTSTGKPFDQAALDRRAQVRQQATQRLVDLSKLVDPQQLRSLGLTDFINEFEQTLKQDPIRLRFTLEGEDKRLRAHLDQAFANFKLDFLKITGVNIAELERLFNVKIETPEQAFDYLDKAKADAAEIRQQLNKATIGGEEQQTARQNLQVALQEIERLASARNVFQGDRADAARQAFNSSVERVKAIGQQSQISQKDVAKLRTEIDSLFGLLGANVNDRLAFNSSQVNLTQAFAQLQQIANLQQQASTPPLVGELQQRLQQLDAIQQKLQSSGFSGQLKQGGDALSAGATGLTNAATASTTIVNNAVTGGNALSRGAQDWIRASQATFNAPATGSSQNSFAKGGFVRYFANGGAARGMDTIPVMARPGEAFINPKSAQRFFSQIQAINAGQQPVYRQHGGPISIGDINVTVQGGSSDAAKGQASGRAIARVLEREVRRGTSRLPRRR